MHFGDSIFIFLLALVLFGPKKLPEIGRTIGKLLAEFRRASNEFKFQIQEELRNMEEDERRKKREDAEAQRVAEATATEAAATSMTPSILPPSTGTPVSTSAPFATPGGEAVVEPSAAEVVVEPSEPSEAAKPGTEGGMETPAHVDVSTNGNGTHLSHEEPVEPSLPSEPLHHG